MSAFEYDPGTAREILENHGLTECAIDGVLYRHAHELAEKIRQASAPMACFRSEDMQARADHGRRMADLIDPESDRE